MRAGGTLLSCCPESLGLSGTADPGGLDRTLPGVSLKAPGWGEMVYGGYPTVVDEKTCRRTGTATGTVMGNGCGGGGLDDR